MNNKDLKWFQEICTQRSITKAAANLFITPQGLSKSIKSLENELGVKLLERTPNGISLTIYGEKLYEKTETLLKDYEDMIYEMEMLKQQEGGMLRICSSYGVFRILGIDFVLDFEKAHPGLSLDYMEFPDIHIEREVAAGYYDVGFAIAPVVDDSLEQIPLFQSTVSLLVYEGHRLYDRESVTFADLEGEDLILESRGFKINGLVKKSCQQAGFEPNILFNTSGFSLCHKLTAQHRGISIVVDKISKDMSRDGIRTIPIADSFLWQAVLIYQKRFANYGQIKTWKQYTLDYLNQKKDA